MRIAIFALAILAGSGAAEARQVEVVSTSPRHIEIAAWCTAGSNCQQEASDGAQGYCHGPDYPRGARYMCGRDSLSAVFLANECYSSTSAIGDLFSARPAAVSSKICLHRIN